MAVEANRPRPEGLQNRRLRGLFRLELRRNLRGRRAFLLFLMALAPVGLALAFALAPFHRAGELGTVDSYFGGFFPLFVLMPLFLSVLFVFSSAFRAEVLGRSLHYLLLTPVRRSWLVLVKYAAALAVAGSVFAASSGAVFVLILLHFGTAKAGAYLFAGPGFGHVLTYCVVAVLACATYGALFLLVGLLFRFPVVPGALIWAWEVGAKLLFPRYGILHYLESMYPIPPPSGTFFDTFEVLAAPTPAPLAILVLLVVIALALTVACRVARTMELAYGGE